MKILERHKETLERDFWFDKVPFVPIDVSNVAEWYFTESEIDQINLRDFPCVISPFQYVWFEYNIPRLWKIKHEGKWVIHSMSFPPETRMGVLILQEALSEKWIPHFDESLFIKAMREKISDYKPPRFVQDTYYFFCGKDRLRTPLSCATYIDEDGRILGTVAQWDRVIGDEHQAQNFQRTWGYSIYFAISLMHCKNVRIDDAQPLPEKVIKKRLKKGKPVVGFKTIYIDSIKRQSSVPGSGGGGSGILRAIDIVRGHFKDYTQGKGLFGHIKGRFWWSERASAETKREYKIRYPQQ